MPLSPEQRDRYARHLLLREVGGQGQQKLLNARIAIVGAGGIGAPALLYLAAAGIGRLTIIDDDAVSLSNLQRQVIHATADVGAPKTESAKQRIAALNPDVDVIPVRQRLTDADARDLLAGHDLILDGADSFPTRFAVNDAALALETPLVSAAVGRFDGQLSVFKGHETGPDRPCYRCLVPEAPPEGAAPPCEQVGVLGALTGVLGTMAALEAIKEVLQIGTSLAGRLLIYDGLTSAARTVRLPRDPDCPFCARPN